jgi:hypothetical protein
LAEGLEMLRILMDDTIGQCVLWEKNFGWMDVWELNPEGLESLWLKAYMISGRRAKPLLHYTLAFSLQLTKSTENFR